MKAFDDCAFPRKILVSHLGILKILLKTIQIIEIFFVVFLGKESDIAGHCKSLITLDISTTSVTGRGTRLAIEHLPNLKTFKCSHSVQVASEMFREGQSDSTTRKLGLMDLHCKWPGIKRNSTPYVRGSLQHAIQLCPFVVHLEIEVEREGDDVTDGDLLALRNLENLRHLVLTSIGASFDGGILPILEKFGGKSLEFLKLSFLQRVDVAAIIRHCSNLRSLEFLEIKQYNVNSSPNPSSAGAVHQLGHLESLSVLQAFMGSERQPKAAVLSLLLRSCPALTKLELVSLNGVTDHVIEQAAIAHSFSKLEVLYLAGCPNITRSTADLLFLTLDCPLRQITLDCDQLNILPKKCKSIWKGKAQENGWELKLGNSDDEFDDSDDEFDDSDEELGDSEDFSE